MTNFPFKAQLVEARESTKGTEFDVLKCVRINYFASANMELIVRSNKRQGFIVRKLHDRTSTQLRFEYNMFMI